MRAFIRRGSGINKGTDPEQSPKRAESTQPLTCCLIKRSKKLDLGQVHKRSRKVQSLRGGADPDYPGCRGVQVKPPNSVPHATQGSADLNVGSTAGKDRSHNAPVPNGCMWEVNFRKGPFVKTPLPN